MVPRHRVQEVRERGARGAGAGKRDGHHLVDQFGLLELAAQEAVDVHDGRRGHEPLPAVLGRLAGLEPFDQGARHVLPEVPAAVGLAHEPGQVAAHAALDDG